MGHQLQPVANSKDRRCLFPGSCHRREIARITAQRPFFENRIRPSRKNNPFRRVFHGLLKRECAGNDLAIDMQLADAARYQLGILRAEIQDQDFLLLGFGASRYSGSGAGQVL